MFLHPATPEVSQQLLQHRVFVPGGLCWCQRCRRSGGQWGPRAPPRCPWDGGPVGGAPGRPCHRHPAEPQSVMSGCQARCPWDSTGPWLSRTLSPRRSRGGTAPSRCEQACADLGRCKPEHVRGRVSGGCLSWSEGGYVVLQGEAGGLLRDPRISVSPTSRQSFLGHQATWTEACFVVPVRPWFGWNGDKAAGEGRLRSSEPEAGSRWYLELLLILLQAVMVMSSVRECLFLEN